MAKKEKEEEQLTPQQQKMKALQAAMAKIEKEKAQLAEENRLREKEINAGMLDSVLKSTVIAVVIGEASYHIGMKVIGKFEESGVYRSLLSKSWISRLGKRK